MLHFIRGRSYLVTSPHAGIDPAPVSSTLEDTDLLKVLHTTTAD